MNHELKIWPQYFHYVANGSKTFEVRKNDRGFSFGDTVLLKEWDPDRAAYFENDVIKYNAPKGYTGLELKFRIGFIFPLDSENVVFSLLPAEQQERKNV